MLSTFFRSDISISNSFQLNNFAVGTATSPFISKSAYGTFIFFGCITVVGIIYVIFMVPETMGRTLEEMDELFGSSGLAAADAERKHRIESEIGLLELVGVETSNEKKLDASHTEEFVETKMQ